MKRENFYILLTKVLTSLENEKYLCVISKDNKTAYRDINYSIVTTYDNYTVMNNTNSVNFSEIVIASRYYDFNYYQSETEEFNTDVIDMERIKNILFQHIIEYPYLIVLYEIILEKYNELRDEIYSRPSNIVYLSEPVKLTFSDEEIDNIVSMLSEYKKEEKEIKTRLRKKEF